MRILAYFPKVLFMTLICSQSRELLFYSIIVISTTQKQFRLHKVHRSKTGSLGWKELVCSTKGGIQLPGSNHTESASSWMGNHCNKNLRKLRNHFLESWVILELKSIKGKMLSNDLHWKENTWHLKRFTQYPKWLSQDHVICGQRGQRWAHSFRVYTLTGPNHWTYIVDPGKAWQVRGTNLLHSWKSRNNLYWPSIGAIPLHLWIHSNHRLSRPSVFTTEKIHVQVDLHSSSPCCSRVYCINYFKIYFLLCIT